MKKKLSRSETGKLGALVTHIERYGALSDLSKLVDKKLLNFIQKWPTKHILVLLSAYKNGRNN